MKNWPIILKEIDQNWFGESNFWRNEIKNNPNFLVKKRPKIFYPEKLEQNSIKSWDVKRIFQNKLGKNEKWKKNFKEIMEVSRMFQKYCKYFHLEKN